jgi:hypothetical protein
MATEHTAQPIAQTGQAAAMAGVAARIAARIFAATALFATTALLAAAALLATTALLTAAALFASAALFAAAVAAAAMATEHAAQPIAQTGQAATAIAARIAARIFAATALLATTALLTTTALLASTAFLTAAATAAAVTTTQQAKERIRASGCAKHQRDGKRRKGNTSVHRETPENTGREIAPRVSGAGGVRDRRWKACCPVLRPRTSDPARAESLDASYVVTSYRRGKIDSYITREKLPDRPDFPCIPFR